MWNAPFMLYSQNVVFCLLFYQSVCAFKVMWAFLLWLRETIHSKLKLYKYLKKLVKISQSYSQI